MKFEFRANSPAYRRIGRAARRSFALSLLEIAILASCGRSSPGTIAVPERFLARETPCTPPAGFRLVAIPNDGAARGGTKEDWDFEVEIFVVSSRAETPPPETTLVARDYRVPLRGGGNRLLSALAPGDDALPLDGRYVDAPDYPAISFTYARLRSRGGTHVPKRLASWFSAAFPVPPEDEVVFIVAVGDLMPGRGAERLLAKPDGTSLAFGDTLPILRAADLTIGNLEGAVTAGNAKATKSYTFKYGPDILPALRDAGFDYLMTTNNHSFDFGVEGFRDTLKALREAGIATSGAGENLSEARLFWRTTLKGLPISVLSCGAYPVERTGFDGSKTAAAGESKAGILWESEEIPELVRAEKNAGAFVVVCVHGGEEYRPVPSSRQRSFYRALADSGCDLVIGSHPHVLQPVETRGNSVIVYSLGNFLFPGMEGMPGAEDSEIARFGVFRGKLLYRELYPARLSGTRVALANR